MPSKKSPFRKDTALSGRITGAKATRVDSNYDGKNSASRKARTKKANS